MTIKSPIPIDIYNRPVVTMDGIFGFPDAITNSFFHRKLSKLYLASETLEKGSASVDFTTYAPSDESITKYFGMLHLMKICADNAEHIKDRFLEFNLKLSLPDLTKNQIEKLDFIKLKDRLMEFVKKDSHIKTVDKYGSNMKMKPFRKDLEQYIKDRNVYTHGQLCLKYPEKEYVVSYIDNFSGGEILATVTPEMLKSHNIFYKEILDFLEAFQQTRAKQSGRFQLPLNNLRRD